MNENSLKTEILISFEVKGPCKWKFEIANPDSCKLLYENLDKNPEKYIVSIPYFLGGEQKIIATAYIIETTMIAEVFSSVKYINKIIESAKEFSLLDLIKNRIINDIITVKEYYKAELTITLGEETPNEKYFLFLEGIGLDKKDFFGSSDPYLVIYKENLNNPGHFDDWLEICRTNIIKDNINPIWEPIELKSQDLYDCRREIKIKIDCYDWNKNSSHELIGSCETKLRELLISGNKLLLYSKKKSKKSSSGYIDKCAGNVQISQFKIEKIYTYMDFIRAGLDICVVIGIDFKKSNGEYKNYLSLHYLSNVKKNPYERALGIIMPMLEKLKRTTKYYVYGFGGIPESQDMPGVFSLNNNQNNPIIKKTEKIIEIYREAVPKITPQDQSFISQIIDGTNASSENYSYAELYTILTIFTDGKDNVELINESIARTFSSPLSIIIVGVEEIKNDPFEIFNKQIEGERHNVVYIPLKEVNENLKSLQINLLGQIIRQVEDFMLREGYIPNIPSLMESYRRLSKINSLFEPAQIV